MDGCVRFSIFWLLLSSSAEKLRVLDLDNFSYPVAEVHDASMLDVERRFSRIGADGLFLSGMPSAKKTVIRPPHSGCYAAGLKRLWA